MCWAENFLINLTSLLPSAFRLTDFSLLEYNPRIIQWDMRILELSCSFKSLFINFWIVYTIGIDKQGKISQLCIWKKKNVFPRKLVKLFLFQGNMLNLVDTKLLFNLLSIQTLLKENKIYVIRKMFFFVRCDLLKLRTLTFIFFRCIVTFIF